MEKEFKTKLTDLHKNEKIKEKIIPSWKGYLGTYFWLFIFFIFPAFIFDAWRRSNKYYITNERIIFEHSFFSRKTNNVYYKNITDVHFTQGLFSRIFNIGNIYLNTAGSHGTEMNIKGVENPLKIKNLIFSYLRK